MAGWESMVENFQALVNKEESQMRFVILEENGGDHGLLRGLGHATYNSIFLKHGDFGVVHGIEYTFWSVHGHILIHVCVHRLCECD